MEAPALLDAVGSLKPFSVAAPKETEIPIPFTREERAAEERAVLAAFTKEVFHGQRLLAGDAVAPPSHAWSWEDVLRLAPDLRASLFADYDKRSAKPTAPSFPPSFVYVSNSVFTKKLGESVITREWLQETYPGFRARATSLRLDSAQMARKQCSS
ncbi:MAG: hypothetical protein IT380_00725 [Myxococcales bacterium]|nr:hypothetical protein [Myxococcales bacterium]